VAHEDPKAEAILKAALDLFVDRGFHGTPVPEVADRAHVGAGTIYRAFANKEALVNALYRRWKQAFVGALVDRFPADHPPREQFRVAWERSADFALAHPRELSFIELHHHGSYLDAESRAIEQRMHEFGRLMVQRAQAAKALKLIDPTLLLELVNGAFIGVFRAAVQGRLPLTKATLMAAEQCCWEAIAA
jgi:TetR/AcrR family transcriptional regulator, repressor of fatR-cypB operon